MMVSTRVFLRLAAAALLAATELAAGVVLSLPLAQPAAAQFFDDRPRRSQGGFPFFPFFDTRPQPRREYRRPAPAPAPADYSRAPAPRKSEGTPATNVVVMGDSLADWLAYGLEDAFADEPEIGITRKHRAHSGLIRYESRRDAQEWPQVVREILAAEKPSFAIMMLGLSDRQSIRERPGEEPGADNETAGSPAAAPERGRQAASVSHEFRTEKWAEAYGRRIDETITALKSRGTPVFWVGLPSIRGAKSTSDVIYLNNLFRSHAEKNGIVYIDVWDGFVDEAGRYALYGPDVEGQKRRLRTSDGVHFTKAGARKLAHYVEREIRRGMTRATPMALPMGTEPALQENARPRGPAVRPLAGPVLPLNAGIADADELLGAAGARQSGVDPTAARVLVKGEPLPPPAGRADDFAWPRRPPAVSGPGPVAAPEPAGTEPTGTAPTPKAASQGPAADQPAAAPVRPRPAQTRRAARPQQEERRAAPRPPAAIPDSLIPFFRPVR